MNTKKPDAAGLNTWTLPNILAYTVDKNEVALIL